MHKPLSRKFLRNRGWCCTTGCTNCPYKYEKAQSKIHGQGIICSKNIQKNERIGKAYDLMGQVNDWHIASKYYPLGKWHNHASEPNCYSKVEGQEVYFYALRSIVVGEEITCDYQTHRDNGIMNLELPNFSNT